MKHGEQSAPVREEFTDVLRARVPGSLKREFSAIAALEMTDEADLLRRACREFLERRAATAQPKEATV